MSYELVGPDNLEGPALAALWTETLGRTLTYDSDDLDAFEQRLRGDGPAWLAHDLRNVMRRTQDDGAAAPPDEVARLTALLGYPPRRYRDFASEMAKAWRGA